MLNPIHMRFKELTAWALQDKHKTAIDHWRAEVEKAFTEHPQDTGETYPQHLWFTVKLSSRFAYAWLVILIHGLFPFLCTRTASSQIEEVYRIMKTRIPQKRREEIDREIRLPLRSLAKHGAARIAIIGGGFSGTMVLAHLIRHASGTVAIEWFEPGESPGTGVAYGTKDPVHLLNVRAGRMGAFAHEPEGFWQWLQTDDGKKHALAFWPDRDITPESFLPRALYGEYLREVVTQSLAEAKQKGIAVRIVHATVVDASLQHSESQQIMLEIDRGGLRQEALVDGVVLATGNLPPRHFHFQTGLMVGEPHYVEDIWHTPKDHVFPTQVHTLSADADIVIIGSGLTMVDTVLTLRTRGYKGTITAISRNGLIPAAHADVKPYPEWDWVLAPHFAPKTALGLLKKLREEVKRAQQSGYDWRSVVDSIRPITSQLWRQLSINEKRRFLHRLFTVWGIHRHRMAPDIHAEIRAMQQNGSLKIIAGKIYYVGSDKDGLTVAYRRRGTNRVETLRPTLVINCTGPEYDIAASSHGLLKNLRDRELITVGPLRAGVEVTAYGTAKGKAQDALFPVGTLLVGELLECTAVPELREQAEKTARKLLERVQSLYDYDYIATLAIGQEI